MFISLGNFLICSYSDKFLYGHLRHVWSSLKCFLILIFTPSIHRKQYLLSFYFERFLVMKKEDLVSLSSWQPLNSGRPAEPTANVRIKACARCWVNFHFILRGAIVQILCWQWVLDALYSSMCRYCGHPTGAAVFFSSFTSWWRPCCLSQKLPLFTVCDLGKSTGEINAPCPSCLPQSPQIWKTWKPVVFPGLRVINHKAIPSGETSLWMEKLTLLPCPPSLEQAAYTVTVICQQRLFAFVWGTCWAGTCLCFLCTQMFVIPTCCAALACLSPAFS